MSEAHAIMRYSYNGGRNAECVCSCGETICRSSEQDTPHRDRHDSHTPPPTREPIRLTDEAEAAWLEWRNTHAIPHWDGHGITEATFKAGFRAARLAGEPTLADATSDLESEIAALLGRTFTYSDPSIYVDYDVPGDTFRIGDVRFSTKALAAVLIAYMADAEQRGREDNADHSMCYVHGSKALAGKLADAWDEGHEDGCIAAHCYTQRGQSYFDESKLTDCHTRNPYRTPESEDTE